MINIGSERRMNKLKIIGLLLCAVLLINLNVIGANAAKGKKVVTKYKTKTITKIITKSKPKIKKTKAKAKIVVKKTTNTVNSHTLSYIDKVDLKSIAYGNKIYVGVGTDGTVMTSKNLKLWEYQQISPENINNVIFARGIFVLVGDDGIIFTSNDGTAWQKSRSNILDNINQVIFANNNFVAVCNAGNILISKDALVWNASQVTKPTDKLTSIACNGSTYFIGNGDFYTKSYSSNDLKTFNDTLLSDGITNVVYTHNNFFAVATIDEPGSFFHTICSTIYISKDGINWSALDCSYEDFLVDSICSTNEGVFFIGRHFLQDSNSGWCKADTIMIDSYINNQEIPCGFTLTDKKGNDLSEKCPIISSVIEVNKKYIGVGDNTGVFESSNGTDWTKLDIAITCTSKN